MNSFDNPFLAFALRRKRYLGLVDECCPDCGGPIETLLNSEGKDPMRCCWRCEVERAKYEERWEPNDAQDA